MNICSNTNCKYTNKRTLSFSQDREFKICNIEFLELLVLTYGMTARRLKPIRFRHLIYLEPLVELKSAVNRKQTYGYLQTKMFTAGHSRIREEGLGGIDCSCCSSVWLQTGHES